MGSIMYGGPDTTIEFDDRTLAHLRAAIVTKLKHGEPFTLHYSNTSRNGSGHTVLWLHPAIPLRFHFTGRTGPVNWDWVEILLASAHNSSGLVLVEEPTAAAGAPPGAPGARPAAPDTRPAAPDGPPAAPHNP